MTVKLGYQIPSFTYPGTVNDIFPQVVAQAKEAEAAGFDTVFVMDHFYQLPMIGDAHEPMLEAYTLLGALASSTSTIQLSTLVTGNTYRNPALLAKIATTLDVVSGGRAVLAIGAGWHELEHVAFGYEFGTFTDRFERLAEALEIIIAMLRGERPSFDGTWYRAKEAINEPRIRDDMPLLIGGSGERKTFALAARHFDHLNIVGVDPEDLPRKLSVLRQRLDEAGRDPATLETSYLARVIVHEDGDRARQLQQEHLERQSKAFRVPRSGRMHGEFVGTPDEVAAQIKEQILDVGVDGVIINMFANGHEPGIVELAGKALAPLIA
ncbi:putative F420-dependent oxidoreductase [Segniliparus rotundus DSM 44985]|uniref:Putative F420-dependent oxidoreductase n=1 Tax=Segniliparus rotundus (strain ATCC BAA-972 / CDC 1076 / CIP 108378 / DSM 44985 / JCM 13578) TaxID=640132 RepID=D6Z9W0_SEGRD|nr:LLM class F420-dependent oxidoreductase [Segniliparus rotundus]ADG98630.1 putative F420-dependent oxidoreductase [Segniliparus rotundus DSM 44985]